MSRFSFLHPALLASGLLFLGNNAFAQEHYRTYHFKHTAPHNPCKVFIGVGTSSTPEGLKVDYTVDDTPARSSGILAGDIILAIDGVPVSSQPELERERDKHQPGDAFRLTILRDGKEMAVQAKFKACSEAELAEQQQRQADKLARLAAMEAKLAEMSAKGLENLPNMTWKERPILGVYENTSLNVTGLAIESVVKGKGAEAAGLMPGDVVVQVDGKTVTGSTTLRNALDGHQAGDRVTVSYVRDGTTLRTLVTLSSDRQPVVQKIERDPCQVFIGVYTSGNPPEGRGLRVQGVIDDTPAKISGVQPGDVILAFNGVPVSNHQQLTGERDKNKPGDAFRLTILRDDQEMTVKARFKACEQADIKLTQETVRVLDEDAAAERGQVQGELALSVFEAYPSPTLGPLNVRFEAEAVPTTVRVLDLAGKEVFRRELPQFNGYFNEEISLANNKAGNYVLSVQQGNKIISKQVVLLPRA